MKNTPYLYYLTLIAFLFNLSIINAQHTELTENYKKQTINSLAKLINDNYVFPDVAKSTAEHLNVELKKGYFNQFTTNDSFAEALTESVQSINKDKHMRIRANRPYTIPIMSPEEKIQEQIKRMERSRIGNYGFNTVEILEGNIGYLDLRGFAGLENAKDIADSYMKLMSRTDAVIIDLRKNGGGSPRMVQYLCSYFFDQKLHLNSLYWRQGDSTEEFWTLDEVGGVKMPNVPLFVITSGYTFSGAEEFSYNMQTQKRATLVGQTTGGGANPGGTMRINDDFSVFIPTGRAINPITKTNWEGVGVIPEVQVSEDDSFNKSVELAQEAAKVYRDERNKNFTQLYLDLTRKLEQFQAGNSEEGILEILMKCKEHKLFSEGDINRLGYEYLNEHRNPTVASCIFKSNTILYPNSPNVFDSYAESLLISGDKEASLANYQRAINIAKANNDPNTEAYQKNFDNAKQKLNAK